MIAYLVSFFVVWMTVNVVIPFHSSIFGSLKRIAGWVYSQACRIVAAFGDINLEPLPRWTNLPLFLLGCGIWAFAISLNWWGDNLTYVITTISILGLFGVAVFVRVEKPSYLDN